MANIIKTGVVKSVDDSRGAMRISFYFQGDEKKSTHIAFPLMPKTFQAMPMEEEVSLILSESEQGSINYYYLGPLIPQPQLMHKVSSEEVKSDICQTSGNKYSKKKDAMQLETPENYQYFKGAFPEKGDVAIVGRKSEDVILKDDEIDIRCGIRQEPINSDNESFKGFIDFNDTDPAYIQLKYGNNLSTELGQDANSMINLVADKINIISHKDTTVGKLANEGKLAGKAEQSYDDLMSHLHQLPYGDELISFLNKLRDAIDNHVHPYPGLIPCKDKYILAIDKYDLDNIISKHVRIS